MLLVYKFESEYYNSLSFTINNACYKKGDRIYQLYSLIEDQEKISIRETSVYKIISKNCSRGYCNYRKLIEELVSVYGIESSNLAEDYILTLIKNHYLLSDIQKDILCGSPREKLLDFISRNYIDIHIKTSLRNIFEMIDLYSKLPIGEGVALLEKIYETMSSIVRSKSYLKIDLISNYSEFSFSTQIQEKFERFANFIALSTESTNKTHLDYYSEAFLEKYGLEREVKLVELLDPCIGLGAPFGYNHPSNDFIMEEPPFEFYSEAEEQMYLDLYTKAVSERRPIELSSIVNHYEKINSEKLSNIDGFDLFFNMVKKDGKTIFSLSNIIGSNTLGGGSGRFAGLSGTLQNFHEKLLQHEDRIGDLDNISTCEILFLPENLRHRNIMNTVSNRNFCLPISTDVSGKKILLEDIYIGLSSDLKFYARDIRSGEFIRFYSTNMYNLTLFCNELRFLVEISIKNNIGKIPWEIIYKNFSYVPRLTFEDIIIAPAKWRVRVNDTMNSVNQIVKKYGLPQTFYIEEGDSRILINLTKQLDYNSFENLLSSSFQNKTQLILTEVIGDDSPVVRNGKSTSSDLVIPFRNTNYLSNCSHGYKKIVETQDFELMDRERRQLPFQEWTYFKIYISEDRQDEFLIGYLTRLKNHILENEGKVFYLRYRDPKPHIRLRISGLSENIELYYSVLSIINEAIKNCIVSTFSIDIYERELERYGGSLLMREIEDIFCVDSQICIEMINSSKLDSELSILDYAVLVNYIYLKTLFIRDDSIIEFLEDVSPSNRSKNLNKTKHHYINMIKNYILKNNLQSNFPIITELSILLHSIQFKINKFEKFRKTSIVDSIIHVHNNRLIGIDREQEKEIYNILRLVFQNEKFTKDK